MLVSKMEYKQLNDLFKEFHKLHEVSKEMFLFSNLLTVMSSISGNDKMVVNEVKKQIKTFVKMEEEIK